MGKSLTEKINMIKNALEKEKITKQEINCHAEYAVLGRILKGVLVREKSADRLLAKIEKIRARRKKESKNSLKVPLGVKEIAIDNIIEKNSNESGVLAKLDIEKPIETKKNVKEKTDSNVEKLVLNLRSENERLKQKIKTLEGEIEQKDKEIKQLHKPSKTVIEPSITVADKQNIVIETVERHEQIIKEVLERIGNLEDQRVIEKSIAGTEKNPGYHGFTVCQLSSGYWQGVRRINGKPNCVYIGRDLSFAEEKIEKWLKKNYPDILKEDTCK